MIFVGHDWAEDHHDLCVLDEAGAELARDRVPEGAAGVARFHELVAGYVDDPDEVVIGTETDQGLFIAALVTVGYQVYAVNPLSVDRYRDRHRVSGGKSDPADAKVLADMVRTDRHLHRRVAADSDEVRALKVLTREHRDLCQRRQAHVNRLRSNLRDYYPAVLDVFGSDLADRDAVALLSVAPTPDAAMKLTADELEQALRTAGRKRNITKRAQQILTAIQTEQLRAPGVIESAYGATTTTTVAVLVTLNAQVDTLETQLTKLFEQHPDAATYLNLPGLGELGGARVLAEFGDQPNRFESARDRRNYTGTSPVTRQSGKATWISVRHAKNTHLTNTVRQWAFCSLRCSPGARAYYDHLRDRNITHNGALLRIGSRWVTILHHLLKTRTAYDDNIAWANWLPQKEDPDTTETKPNNTELRDVA